VGRFDGKIIFITGAGSGLGRECAYWWAEEGATIIATDVVEKRAVAVAEQINEKGGNALAIKVDVGVEADVESAVAKVVDEFGRIDVMFANAGKPVEGFGSVAFEDVSEAQWDDVNDAVYKGVFFCGKHAARVMKRQGGGNIVVTTSAGGLNAYPGFAAYNAGKAGAIGLVRSMAFDLGGYGIRVNGLAPTHGMSANFALPPDAEVMGLSYEEAELAQAGAQWDPKNFPGPLKLARPPRLRDNAAVATFLASDDSEYMSGIVIPSCDGGSFARTSIVFPESWTLEDQV
jgi:NAD(P)-dependent dehydrogenase (short-subunit alcohol dehydrogenase family)